MNRPKITNLRKKNDRFGFMLALPFLIGFILFFLSPMIQSIIFSFNIVSTDISKGLLYKPVGFAHYIRIFTSDVKFRETLFSNAADLCVKVPMIVIFSLSIAVVLNKRFFGKNIAKIVFFLPVITTSGVMHLMESSDYLLQTAQKTVSGGGELLKTYNAGYTEIKSIFLSMQIDEKLLQYLMAVIDKFYEIVIASGVPITLLLAALQSIPSSLYEASEIEGATAWETFWKITLPMVSSYVYLCGIYAIIDSFTNSSNKVIKYIMDTAYGTQLNYGFASAMSWLYFIVIGIFLAIIGVFFMQRRASFYHEL